MSPLTPAVPPKFAGLARKMSFTPKGIEKGGNGLWTAELPWPKTRDGAAVAEPTLTFTVKGEAAQTVAVNVRTRTARIPVVLFILLWIPL